jgi:hypothetical protein
MLRVSRCLRAVAPSLSDLRMSLPVDSKGKLVVPPPPLWVALNVAPECSTWYHVHLWPVPYPSTSPVLACCRTLASEWEQWGFPVCRVHNCSGPECCSVDASFASRALELSTSRGAQCAPHWHLWSLQRCPWCPCRYLELINVPLMTGVPDGLSALTALT